MSKGRNGPEDSTKKPLQAARNLDKLVMRERLYQEDIGIDIIVGTTVAARSTCITAQPSLRRTNEMAAGTRKWQLSMRRGYLAISKAGTSFVSTCATSLKAAAAAAGRHLKRALPPLLRIPNGDKKGLAMKTRKDSMKERTRAKVKLFSEVDANASTDKALPTCVDVEPPRRRGHSSFISSAWAPEV